LSKFSLICGLAKHGSGNTEEFHQARTEANVLHAHLVVVREARAAHYFTATAYAVFCLRGDHDRRKAERVEEAREKVETLLCDPSKPFDVPTDDEVCRFAAIAWANVGHPVWLKL
jgi:hypothetical protein